MSAMTSDSFPKQALLWLVPGVVGLLMGLAFFAYFERRANHQIVFINPMGELWTVRADGDAATEIDVGISEDALFFTPHWAPDGRKLASIAQENQTSQVIVTVSEESEILYRKEAPAGADFQFPGDAWAQDSQHLAVISQSIPASADAEILILNINATDEITTGLTLNIEGGTPQWHPTENLLLIPTITDSITATLHVVSPDGISDLFAPTDEQDMRLFGDWSPDGGQVAYVGIQTSTVTSTVDITRTTILVANRDGTNSRPLVSDGLNYAPFWAPRGDYIFFTRMLISEIDATTNVATYQLCRVTLDGSEPDCFGQSTPSFLSPFLRRHTLAAWSPDNTKFFFQGYDPMNFETSLYVSNAYDGSNPVELTEENIAHLTVLWSPTNRALLINNPGSFAMSLQWIDQERPGTDFPSGKYPTWQP